MRFLPKFVLILSVMAISISAYASSVVKANPVDAKGHVGQEILVRAAYQYHVVNDTGHVRHYLGYEKLTVDNVKWSRNINFYLKPNETKNVNNDTGFIKYKAKKKGDFPIYATIEIESKDGGYDKEMAMLQVTG